MRPEFGIMCSGLSSRATLENLTWVVEIISYVKISSISLQNFYIWCEKNQLLPIGFLKFPKLLEYKNKFLTEIEFILVVLKKLDFTIEDLYVPKIVQ